jgi:hypothetical protein
MNGQSAPTNWTGKPGNFYELGTSNASTGAWLESFFEKAGQPLQCYRRQAVREGGRWVQH